MFAQRHFHEYGTTREQLAQIRVERAQERGAQPEGHLPRPDCRWTTTSPPPRMISSPFCLFDLRTSPCDGGTAVIVSRIDQPCPTCASRRSRSRPSAPRFHGRPSWDQFDDLATMACPRRRRAQLWTRTDLTPGRRAARPRCTTGFSFITNGVARGDAVLRRRRVGPVSSRGGPAHPRSTASSRSTPTAASCRRGRLHGFGFIPRGPACNSGARAGDRQVPNDPEVGVACRRRRPPSPAPCC